MKKLASAFLMLSLLLMIAPMVSAEGQPSSCAEIKNGNPGAADGEYTMSINGNSVSVYCGNMSGTPTEYLTLAHTGNGVNFSYYASGGNSSGLTTQYTKVRFNPGTLTVNIADTTFSTSTGYKRFGYTYYYTNDYATAADCRGDGSAAGTANVDLTGTPFFVQPNEFLALGWNPGGSSVYSSNGQVVNLTGGGYCGGTSPQGPLLKLGIFDNVPPATQATLPSTANAAGWYNSDFTVTLNAEDNQSGVQKINYSLNGGAYVEAGGSAASVPITADGVYTLHYYSVDSAGNTEQEKSINFKLDKTAPAFSLSSNGAPFVDGTSYRDDQGLTFNLASEDALSGVVNQTLTIDGQSYVNGSSIDLAGKLGGHSLHIVITDQAGNMTDETLMFKVDTSAQSVENLIDRYIASGDITGTQVNLLKNLVSQVNHQLSKGDSKQAAKFLPQILQRLNDNPKLLNVSPSAKDAIIADLQLLLKTLTES